MALSADSEGKIRLRFSSIVAAENIQEEALGSFMIVVPKPFYISMRLVAIKPLCDSFIDFKFQILLILNSLIDFFPCAINSIYSIPGL